MVDIFIAEELKDVINLSLTLKIYPEAWKTAILKPLFKGGLKNAREAKSYRPVSLLCSMARVMEGLLNVQMNNYAEEVDLLHPGVHGYRRSNRGCR